MPSTASPAPTSTSPPARGAIDMRSASSTSNTVPHRAPAARTGTLAKSLPSAAYIGSLRESPPECSMTMRALAKSSAKSRAPRVRCASCRATCTRASTVAAPEPMRLSCASGTTITPSARASTPRSARDASCDAYARACRRFAAVSTSQSIGALVVRGFAMVAAG